MSCFLEMCCCEVGLFARVSVLYCTVCDDIWWNDCGYQQLWHYKKLMTCIDVILVVFKKHHCRFCVLYCLYLWSVSVLIFHFLCFIVTIRPEWMLEIKWHQFCLYILLINSYFLTEYLRFSQSYWKHFSSLLKMPEENIWRFC